MRGHENVIAELNAALRAELTAIIQYMVHAEMRTDWGYGRMGGETRKHAIEEMRHAEKLIERILYLDGTPKVDIGLAPQIGPNVRAQIEADRAAEAEAVQQYNRAVAICQELGDNGSRDLFQQLLNDEEQHLDFLEAQLHSMDEVGAPNYLAQQMDGGENGGGH